MQKDGQADCRPTAGRAQQSCLSFARRGACVGKILLHLTLTTSAWRAWVGMQLHAGPLGTRCHGEDTATRCWKAHQLCPRTSSAL